MGYRCALNPGSYQLHKPPVEKPGAQKNKTINKFEIGEGPALNKIQFGHERDLEKYSKNTGQTSLHVFSHKSNSFSIPTAPFIKSAMTVLFED